MTVRDDTGTIQVGPWLLATDLLYFVSQLDFQSA
jgi:hypothetical protein